MKKLCKKCKEWRNTDYEYFGNKDICIFCEDWNEQKDAKDKNKISKREIKQKQQEIMLNGHFITSFDAKDKITEIILLGKKGSIRRIIFK